MLETLVFVRSSPLRAHASVIFRSTDAVSFLRCPRARVPYGGSSTALPGLLPFSFVSLCWALFPTKNLVGITCLLSCVSCLNAKRL